MLPILLIAVAIAIPPLPSWANKVDCAEQQTNLDAKICTQRQFERADKELNAAYVEALKAARQQDRYASEEPNPNRPGLEKLLRKAQREWVAFRDLNCDFHYNVYYGGSMASLAYLACKLDMTKARAKELNAFVNLGEETSPQE